MNNLRSTLSLVRTLCTLIVVILAIFCQPYSEAFQPSTNCLSNNAATFHSAVSGSQWLQQFLIRHSSVLRAKTQGDYVEGGWFPNSSDDVISSDNDAIEEIEQKAVQLSASLIRKRLNGENKKKEISANNQIASMVKGRFMDLASTEGGERALESLFEDDEAVKIENKDIIRGAIMTIQSLCVMGTQLGVMGPPERLRKMVSHLDSRCDPSLILRDLGVWDSDSVRRLKYQLDRKPATQLLSELLWKRSPQGAFNLLVAIGAWRKHEDLALLRSGFPLRFSVKESEAALEASKTTSIRDPDEMLGIRKDLRYLKVFTIDSASTSEIDDGLSVEVIQKKDGSEGRRIWIHIADAGRWAVHNSTLFETASKRITSIYLPHGSISMFPPAVSTDTMSLKTKRDSFAVSLGLELNEDGSIDASSLIITPSMIRILYRLTYDEVDEMLEEGIGYSEEWELGALLDAAKLRREYRVRNGSTEGLIQNPIPYSSISTYQDRYAPDGIGISVKVEVSHNAGKNQSVETGLAGNLGKNAPTNAAPVSSAYLLVTENMILGGEALGRWKIGLENKNLETKGSVESYPNTLRLPFRTQPEPDFKSRAREKNVMMKLRENNVGDGLCHAWYSRRFFSPVKISEKLLPHYGLGLGCYVQWTSPIRRFSDLQVHAAVKRYLRRQRLHEMIKDGTKIPPGLIPSDFGLSPEIWQENGVDILLPHTEEDLDQDIDLLQGIGLIGASRVLQRQSQTYWLFEHVRRLQQSEPAIVFQAVVLGCVDPAKQQYAIYVYELGLEHRYTSPMPLQTGAKLQLKIENVQPRAGILTFVRVV